MDDLSAETETIFTTKGEYKETFASILKQSRDKQKEDLVFYLGFKQPDDFSLTKDSSDASKTKLLTVLRNVSEFSAGSKLFINPRVYQISRNKLPKSEDRKLDYYFRFPFEKYDTTIFKLPAGFRHDALPENKEFKCDYASYKTKYW